MSCSWFLLVGTVLLMVTAWQDIEALALRKDADLASSFGGCAEVGLCCQGKNNTCRVRERRNDVTGDDDDDDDNSVFLVGRRSTCFCDSACIDLSDCCHDYKQTCTRKFYSTVGRSKQFEELLAWSHTSASWGLIKTVKRYWVCTKTLFKTVVSDPFIYWVIN